MGEEGLLYNDLLGVAIAYTVDYVFKCIDQCIKDLCLKKVMQVMTNNASYIMATTGLSLAKRLNLFWTSCAAHTLNFMIKGIAKIN